MHFITCEKYSVLTRKSAFYRGISQPEFSTNKLLMLEYCIDRVQWNTWTCIEKGNQYEGEIQWIPPIEFPQCWLVCKLFKFYCRFEINFIVNEWKMGFLLEFRDC